MNLVYTVFSEEKTPPNRWGCTKKLVYLDFFFELEEVLLFDAFELEDDLPFNPVDEVFFEEEEEDLLPEDLPPFCWEA